MGIAPSRVTAQLGEGYCAFSNGSSLVLRKLKAKDPMEKNPRMPVASQALYWDPLLEM